MPITSPEQPRYQLTFERTEAKYLLTDAQRARLMRAMATAMRPDEFGPSTVRSLYLDTPAMLLARRSLDHPAYREKVRIRAYGPATGADPVFLELKKKCDGITYKRRCALPLEDALALAAGTRDPQGQVELELSCTARREGGLLPAVLVAYDRQAFYATDDHDFRMTLDRRPRVRWDRVDLADDSGELLLSPGLSILEVKTSRAMPLWLVEFLTAEGLQPASFSKYGAAYRLRYPRGWYPETSTFLPASAPAPLSSSGPAPTPRPTPARVPAPTPDPAPTPRPPPARVPALVPGPAPARRVAPAIRPALLFHKSRSHAMEADHV